MIYTTCDALFITLRAHYFLSWLHHKGEAGFKIQKKNERTGDLRDMANLIYVSVFPLSRWHSNTRIQNFATSHEKVKSN